MTELQTFTYEAFVGKLENGREVLASQLAFKTIAGGTWQTPYQLEKL